MDIRCNICGEPWDAYGANHGDMLTWEYDLFRKGAGCPSCQGVSNKDHIEDRCQDLLMNCEDPDNWFPLGNTEKPEWKKPEPKVYWKCEHCKVAIIEDLEITSYDGSQKDLKLDLDFSKVDSTLHYWIQKEIENSFEGISEDPHYELDGYTYCCYCATNCADCDTIVLRNNADEMLDTYDSGKSFVRPGEEYCKDPDYLCVDCYEKESSEQEHETALENLDYHCWEVMNQYDDWSEQGKEAFVEHCASAVSSDISYQLDNDIIKEKIEEYWDNHF